MNARRKSSSIVDSFENLNQREMILLNSEMKSLIWKEGSGIFRKNWERGINSLAKQLSEYKVKIKNFNVNQNLLDKLNEEHKIICDMSKNYVNEIKPPQTPFKYYTNISKKFVTVYFPK